MNLKSVWNQIRFPLILVLSLAVLVVGARFASQYFDSESSELLPETSYKKIDWIQLRRLDVQTGEMPEILRALNEQNVMIPGFIVPLEDEQTLVSEFLFVPTAQACIHVPAPPPNQMIYVKMREPISFTWNFRAFWLKGKLKIEKVDSPYGAVSYGMDGHAVEVFSSPRQSSAY